MMTNNFVLYSGKILVEIVRDILLFPMWWYGRGLLLVFKKMLAFLENRQKSLALLVWIKNIGKPMYGQQDWQGKLISFFIRLVQIIFRSIIMLFYCFIALAIFCFWLALPFLVSFEIIYQLI